MALEFITRRNSFNHCQEAMEYMTIESRPYRLAKRDTTQNEIVFHEAMKVVNDLLALSIQFEKYPTKNYEHYPRLTKDYAKEIIDNVYYDMSKEAVEAFTHSYIENFDIHTVIN